MWQVAVLWCYVEGVITVKFAAAATFTVLTTYSNLHSAHTLNVAPQYRNLPHPTLPAMHSICSNKWSFLLKMGIKMPETC